MNTKSSHFSTLRSGELQSHPLYARVATREQLATFMRLHVFAVWDFMCLLKRLQRDLTCVALPWLPPPDPVAAWLINTIVLGEESDLVPGRDTPCSHFELYRDAMHEVGADTDAIDTFIARLRAMPLGDAVGSIPEPARTFVCHTMRVVNNGATHEVAAAFLFGREDPIPQMFRHLVATLDASGIACPQLRTYLERHIEVDAGEHGPLATRLIERLCGSSESRRQESERAACAAIDARIALWDGIAGLL